MLPHYNKEERKRKNILSYAHTAHKKNKNPIKTATNKNIEFIITVIITYNDLIYEKLTE